MDAQTFCHSRSSLGEGPIWHPARQSLFWVDINNDVLFEKLFSDVSNVSASNSWKLPEKASGLAIDELNQNVFWMITDKSFGRFSILDGCYEPVVKLDIPAHMRSNDAGVAPSGSFYFGTMERKPTGLNGALYSISNRGKLRKLLTDIGIPNTFCWTNDGSHFFLSDSYQQEIRRCYVFDDPIKFDVESFVDLKNTDITPDGGAVDFNDCLWNSQWDGHRVACYAPSGKIRETLSLPVPRPTSCCFGGPDNRHLFITSASEGLNNDELKQYPLSGAVFVIKLSVAGLPIPTFSLNEG